MARQPETRLQRKIQKAIKATYGGWWVKFWGGPFTPAGVPDLIGCIDGMFFALEVKRPMKSSKTSEVQDETIADICGAGGHATVVRSVDDALQFIANCLKSRSNRGQHQPQRPRRIRDTGETQRPASDAL